jgi:hypothetical protein
MVMSHVFAMTIYGFLTLSNRSRSKLLIVHTRGCFIPCYRNIVRVVTITTVSQIRYLSLKLQKNIAIVSQSNYIPLTLKKKEILLQLHT